MKQESYAYKNPVLSKVFFGLSIVVFAYWLTAQLIDVYRSDVTGAAFEILWIFMLLGLFVLPITSFILMMQDKFNFRSLYFYTIIIAVVNILVMMIFFS
jgi:hypothetical protein